MMHGRRRRGHRGFGPPGFERQFFGGGRKAGRGDIRAAILALLAEEPMHGYQIIQELVGAHRRRMAPQPRLGLPDAPAARGRGAGPDAARATAGGCSSSPTTGREQAAALPSAKPWETAGEGDDELAALRDLAFRLLGATRQVAVAGTAKQIEAAQAILRTARRKAMYQLLAEDGDGEADAAEGSS